MPHALRLDALLPKGYTLAMSFEAETIFSAEPEPAVEAVVNREDQADLLLRFLNQDPEVEAFGEKLAE